MKIWFPCTAADFGPPSASYNLRARLNVIRSLLWLKAAHDQEKEAYGAISRQDVFVHISAVEKAGLSNLNEGAKVSYEEMEKRGKTSAENRKI
jgi:cold shock CspA family protein